MNTKLKHIIPGYLDINIIPMQSGVIKIEATRHFNSIGVTRAVSQLLRGFGINTQDGNFKDTPRRVTKMWSEWMRPQELKLAVFNTSSRGAVTLCGHEAISVCPHHLLPFTMSVDLAYIPQHHVVGLSKLARLVDLTCASFVLQEHIPQFIVEVLSTLLLPKGVICRVKAQHGCMRMRGVKTTGVVSTVALDGVYLTDEKARAEFMEESK